MSLEDLISLLTVHAVNGLVGSVITNIIFLQICQKNSVGKCAIPKNNAVRYYFIKQRENKHCWL